MRIYFLLFFIFFAVFFGQAANAQTPSPRPKASPVVPDCKDCPPPVIPPEIPFPAGRRGSTLPPVANEGRRIGNEKDVPSEKSILVDSEVAINLKVCEGNIKINGWDRNELRVFVNGGSKVGFRYTTPKNKNELINWVTILGYDPKEDKGPNLSECLFGDDIELDVPRGSRITKLKGGETNISIKSVAKAAVENSSGNVSLSEIQEEIEVTTYEGNISVENSNGAISLKTFDGEIFAYNTEALEKDDVLKAMANNSITLQGINHSIIEAKSTSGVLSYHGEIQSEGQYSFSNTSGQILLSIPDESSCMLEISAPKGKILYSVPLKILTDDVKSSSIRRLTGQMGDGEATVNLTSSGGRIVIRKIN